MAGFIHRGVRDLLAAGVEAKELLCDSLPITSDYFHKHGRALSMADSEALSMSLAAAGYLDKDGLLRQDPRESSWREVS
jgi:hypothetical protein